MSELIARLPMPVLNSRGGFHADVMGCHRQDGSWHGWIEFVAVESEGGSRYTTGVETHQQTRTQLERWASGLTPIYAEGALGRARPMDSPAAAADLLTALTEIVSALDRRVPHIERAGESQIAADAQRLRDAAVQRIASLRAEAGRQ